MIRADKIYKYFETQSGWAPIIENLSLTVEKGCRIGILGRNGAGKSTLIKILGGITLPDSGTIERHMSLSWPLAFSGGFQGSLTGLDNLKFICRIYDTDIDNVRPFVEDFAELGKYFLEPVKTYSAGMKARLAFALSMAVDFDCYLIDEALSVGDDRFSARCHEELLVKRADKAMVLVSHSAETIKRICHKASVLHNKTLHHFDNVEDAYHFYQETIH
jgi:capsular polysaccharide transport system ATP-binding protein